MTAEELKAAVREYADSYMPSWKYGFVTLRTGSVLSDLGETLLVMRHPENETSDDSSSPQESLSTPQDA
jgi:hypothetical protein